MISNIMFKALQTRKAFVWGIHLYQMKPYLVLSSHLSPCCDCCIPPHTCHACSESPDVSGKAEDSLLWGMQLWWLREGTWLSHVLHKSAKALAKPIKLNLNETLWKPRWLDSIITAWIPSCFEWMAIQRKYTAAKTSKSINLLDWKCCSFALRSYKSSLCSLDLDTCVCSQVILHPHSKKKQMAFKMLAPHALKLSFHTL